MSGHAAALTDASAGSHAGGSRHASPVGSLRLGQTGLDLPGCSSRDGRLGPRLLRAQNEPAGVSVRQRSGNHGG
jgi:hypothetical protein